MCSDAVVVTGSHTLTQPFCILLHHASSYLSTPNKNSILEHEKERTMLTFSLYLNNTFWSIGACYFIFNCICRTAILYTRSN